MTITPQTIGEGANAETVYPGDFVLIKEVGWAIKSVEWVPYAETLLFEGFEYNPLINPPYISSFVNRPQIGIYADVDAYPQANQTLTNYTYADIKVTIEGLIPPEGAYVMLEKIDPPNDYLPDEFRSEGDNVNENFSWIDGSSLKFTWSTDQNPIMNTVLQSTVSVSTQPGNNYIIKASKGKADDPTPGSIFSPPPEIDPDEVDNYVLSDKTLTVWRRLWMETDTVEGAGPLDDSLLKQEMKKACIVVMDLHYSSPPIVDVAMEAEGKKDANGNFIRFSDGKIDYHHNILDLVSGSKDHVTPSPSSDFWYVHAISAKKLHMIDGEADVMTITKDVFGNIIDIVATSTQISNDYSVLGIRIPNNTVLVFNETIEDRAGEEHPNHTIVVNGVSSPYIYPDAGTIKRDTLLHEIVHMFGIGDNENGSDSNIIYDIMCYTYNSKDGSKPVIAYEHVRKMQECTNPE